MTRFRPMTSSRNYDRFEDDYISWLYEKVGRDSKEYGCFWRLIKRLYLHPFYVKSEQRSQTYKDINRIRDGLDLRIRFADEMGYNPDILAARDQDFALFFDESEACSMLEMLVAFAIRIRTDIMWDPDDEDRTSFWFWTMLSNTGLDLKKVKDSYFNEKSMIEIEEICSKIVDRTYQKTGRGSLFPLENSKFLLENSKRDLRKVELWYQMQFWIGENFPI